MKETQQPLKEGEFMSNRQRNRRSVRRKRSSDYPSTKHRSTGAVKKPEITPEPSAVEPEAPSPADD
ncbi:hypothetical protein [Kitasatospora sp. NPDC088134]|uniref:hypothetical protein n=1 Tax=Kitasatospora sp. NPDC088134 TaxID=3364071 RepID=UPI0038226699